MEYPIKCSGKKTVENLLSNLQLVTNTHQKEEWGLLM